MQDSFRTVYREPALSTTAAFRIYVLGYRMLRQTAVDVPGGMPTWFMHHFHDPVRVAVGDGVADAPADSFYIDAPGRRIFHGVEKEWTHSWLRLDGREVGGMISSRGLRPGVVYPLTCGSDSLHWLEGVDHLMSHSLGPDEKSARAVVGLWLDRVRFLQGRGGEPIPQPALSAKRYIESNFRDNINLDDISGAANLSRSQLCRLFRTAFSTSPQEYVIRCRLHHARELLQTTCLLVGEIAIRSGFKDVYYFSRLYKSRMGHSPKEERGGG